MNITFLVRDVAHSNIISAQKPTAAVIVTYHVKAIYPLCPTTDSPFIASSTKRTFKCMAENFMQRHSFFCYLNAKAI